ncbi:MAG: MBL fold metallo-hydrolase [bacterium]|nr:MBL fold metallo-hydrolase [bacterium]
MFVFNTQAWQIRSLAVGAMQTNCYFLSEKEEKKTLIIDPGDEGDFLSEQILELQLQPQAIFFTHGHFDHVTGALPIWLNFSPRALPVFLDPHDTKLYARATQTANHFSETTADPIIPVQKTQTWQKAVWQKLFPHTDVEIIAAPGHTPGGVVLYFPSDHFAFVGDLLFADGSVGRSDFAYSRHAQLQKSIQKIKSLPPETLILPGHGEAFTLANVL